MISNPMTYFVNGQERRQFLYEGGSKLYHFSPYDNGLTDTMEDNVVFWANDPEHARQVLERAVAFAKDCLRQYRRHLNETTLRASDDLEYVEGKLAKYLQAVEGNSLVIRECPTNQFMVVNWASNDTCFS